MQFAEGLSDRQAAETVRSRIDLKYVLSLDLDDPGFDFSVLTEFRTRLEAYAEVVGRDGMVLLDTVYTTGAPGLHRELSAVDALRRVRLHQFVVEHGALRLRTAKELLPAGLRIETPYCGSGFRNPDAHLTARPATTTVRTL